MNQALGDQFSKDDAEGVISACNIALGEVGGFELEDLITKMYKLYPEILLEQRKKDKESSDESDKQGKTRIFLSDLFFEQLDLKNEITPQIGNLFVAYEIFKQETPRDDHYYDEWLLGDTCLCADLIKYHGKELLDAGLLEELNTIAESNYEKHRYAKTNLDDPKDYWHFLLHVVEQFTYEFRDYDRENALTPCNMCKQSRLPNGTFQCDDCKKKREVEEANEKPYDHESETKKYQDERKIQYQRIESERDQILKDAGL